MHFVVFFAIFALYCNIFQTFHGKHYCLCNNFVAYCFSKKKKKNSKLMKETVMCIKIMHPVHTACPHCFHLSNSFKNVKNPYNSV